MSVFTIGGLASGLDTTQIIEQLMEIERQPLTKLNSRKQNYQIQMDAWRDINTRLSNLKSKIEELKSAAIYDSKKATSSDKDVATATATTDAIPLTYEINITNVAKAHRIASDQQADSSSSLGLSGTVQINGKSVAIENSFSLTDIQNAINSTDEIGVKASIINDTLILESSSTGVDNKIELVDDNNVLVNLGILDSDGSTIKNPLQDAQDASLTINGVTVTNSSNTIDDAVEGVTFNIKSTGAATIEISRDVEKIVNAVEAFVNQYNSVQNFINSKLDYNPETKKAGDLQGDVTLMRTKSNLRRYITALVDIDSKYNQLAMVGISINAEGTMTFDSDKFKNVLDEAPEDVKKLFTATETENGFDGVAVRLDSYLNMLLQSNTGVIPEKVDSYRTIMKNIDDEIYNLEKNLERIKERYIKEFTALEKAISKMQQQNNWLMNQLATLSYL